MKQIGGARLNFGPRVSEDRLLKQMSFFFQSLNTLGDFESFGGVNVYLQLYNINGERLVIINDKDKPANLFDLSHLDSPTDLPQLGYKLLPVAEFEKQEADKELAQRRRHEKEEQERRLREEERWINEIEEKKQLTELKKTVLNVIDEQFDISTSAKIKQERTIMEYTGYDAIPKCGFVFRVSIKDVITGRVVHRRIYDDKFQLLNIINLS